MSSTAYDAVIVGSGPNGLAAAIHVAQAGGRVLLIEGSDTIGGGMRSAEVTLPGFLHDICSAIHPFMVASPFFKRLPLREHGLMWVEPPAELAHPLDRGDAVLVWHSVEETAKGLGIDGGAYVDLFKYITTHADTLLDQFLAPFTLPKNLPVAARFGIPALLPASLLARLVFKTERARGMFAGTAAHSVLPLHFPATAAFGLMLQLTAHTVGWVFPRGGAQQIPDALARYLRALGGEIVTGQMVRSLGELPPARAVLLDISPRSFLEIAGDKLPPHYRARLTRFRYGPGACKVDYALSAPIPWTNPAVAQAGTVHLGSTLSEIAEGERAAWNGRYAQRPFVLVAQHSLFDETRAPQGKHTVWAYCHVPNGSSADVSAYIEAQIERYAPGFREVVLAKSVRTAVDMHAYNPNYVGGDINGGAQDITQLFTRPAPQFDPYRTPIKGVYLCSSSTPPGGGVHGMCGYHAAESALKRM